MFLLYAPCVHGYRNLGVCSGKGRVGRGTCGEGGEGVQRGQERDPVSPPKVPDPPPSFEATLTRHSPPTSGVCDTETGRVWGVAPKRRPDVPHVGGGRQGGGSGTH